MPEDITVSSSNANELVPDHPTKNDNKRQSIQAGGHRVSKGTTLTADSNCKEASHPILSKAEDPPCVPPAKTRRTKKTLSKTCATQAKRIGSYFSSVVSRLTRESTKFDSASINTLLDIESKKPTGSVKSRPEKTPAPPQDSDKITSKSDDEHDTKKIEYDTKKIQEYVTPRMKKLTKKARQSGGIIKLSKNKLTSLPASITVTEEGRVFIHTKNELGRGLEKAIKLNIEVFTGEKRVRAFDKIGTPDAKEWVSKEPAFFEKFKNIEGIAKAQVYRYKSPKSGHKKVGLSMPAYNAGSIDGLMMKPAFRENRVAQFKALRSMANAVNEMHRLKCTHGDLKPGNLLVNYDEKEPTKIEVGLSDFGMALDFSNPDAAKEQAVAGTGTPGFQAPEASKDVSTIEPTKLQAHFEGIDRYAFGASVFSVLAGANTEEELVKFRNNSWKDYSDQDIENFIQPLRGQPGITSEVLELLKRSLNKDPSVRPSMQEWIPALARAAD